MLQNLFKFDSELLLIIDRNQWQNTNILMISVPWKKRALPIYWHILSHKGASNLQQFLCWSTTVGTLHATSLQGFGYGDVVHQFEKRCNRKKSSNSPCFMIIKRPDNHDNSR